MATQTRRILIGLGVLVGTPLVLLAGLFIAYRLVMLVADRFGRRRMDDPYQVDWAKGVTEKVYREAGAVVKREPMNGVAGAYHASGLYHSALREGDEAKKDILYQEWLQENP